MPVTNHYDIVIVGGGIQGAAVAQAAAARGYTVMLLEKTALAAATSSRSSKLIHGGLRYLENGHFALVYESLRERADWLRLAPSLVRLSPFSAVLQQCVSEDGDLSHDCVMRLLTRFRRS